MEAAKGDPALDTQAETLIDPKAFLRHIERLLPLIIDVENTDVDTEFGSRGASERVQKFCSDPQIQVIYIIKDAIEGEVKTERDASEMQHAYIIAVRLDLIYTPNHAASLAIIKRSSTVDATRPLQQQLQIFNLPGPSEGGNPYEALHSYIHNAVSPFFDAFSSQKASAALKSDRTGREDKDNRSGIPMAKKKIAELELSLLQLQQNVEIPEVVLHYNSVVVRTIDSCREQGKRVNVDAVGEIINDSAFLNRLQSDVNGWIKEIQKVTKLSRDPSSGSASQEINFWLNMERALGAIDEQLKSPQVQLTLDILKHAKRFHATVSFYADTGMKDAVETVQKYNILMKDFPLNELLSTTDIRKLQESLIYIFNHLNKKLKLSPYPIRRALPLVEAISRDMNEQLLKGLGMRRLMYMGYEDFERTMSGCEEMFRTWDDQVKEFTNVARDVTRKRSEKFLPIKINPVHAKLQERIVFLRSFRRQHEQLQDTIVRVNRSERAGHNTVAKDLPSASLSLSGSTALDDIKAAYNSIKMVDVLDVTPEGTEIWIAAENAYNEQVAQVENQIIARLRDRLGTCRNANEMFRVFSKFNALFVRPKIRGAIQEYQTQLIDNVKEDINKLHDKFKMQYRNSEAFKMSALRDVPPIAGAIIWARQIERQLGLYMNRVEDVLGKGWALYAEGQKLEMESSSFRKKLDTKPIFETWLAEVQKRDLAVTGRIFEITRNRVQNGVLRLGINFEGQAITLFKEVRNLIWLNFQVPHPITSIAKDAKRVYPFAVSLSETVRTYTHTVNLLESHENVIPLVAAYRRDVQSYISRGIQLRWDYFVNTFDSRPLMQSYSDGRENRHVAFVRDFAAVVAIFQDKVTSAIASGEEIEEMTAQLKKCPFSHAEFSDRLAAVQKLIDRLNLENYANLSIWTRRLSAKLEDVLVGRLRHAVNTWTWEFLREDSSETQTANNITKRRQSIQPGMTSRQASESQIQADQTGDKQLVLDVLIHEITLKNQVMYLHPPLERARQDWYTALHKWLSNVCSLKPLQSTSYEMNVNNAQKPQAIDYSNLLSRIPNELESCYYIIEEKTKEVQQYTDIWLRYQSLWDLESKYVCAQLGSDLNDWQQLVLEIKKARATFDNSKSQKSFGPIIVDYEQVQAKVNSKYDQWQKEMLNKFGTTLEEAMRSFYGDISTARINLEQHLGDGTSTVDAVKFIIFVQSLKAKLPAWMEDIQSYRSSQKVLERQRFQFPNNWLYVDNVDGEWSAFNEILEKKDKVLMSQVTDLQTKVTLEDKAIGQRIRETVLEWEKTKPLQGNVDPTEAMQRLNIFEGRFTRLQEEYSQISIAKEVLNLDHRVDTRLTTVIEELRDLSGVWAALAEIWVGINEIRDTQWSTLAPRKVREQLNQALTSIREMPSRLKQYAAFDYAQETLKSYLKVNPLITEMKAGVLKERHWSQLLKALSLNNDQTLQDLSVGTLWDVDLKKHEAAVRDILTVAQGELALEEFLRQVKETWNTFAVDLVVYQNKCRLISGWDELFNKCTEHINSLTAMKHSPYIKVFEEEANAWESKLNRIHVLFDVWIDVQRQWVYLEGIFNVSVDIKHLLPVESSRFQSINAEFMSLMKKVYKSPLVLDVLAIPGIQKIMERLADLLSKIQRALGDYLERERSSFPRFYFVGDEDLLELIGNSKDILKVEKHLKKMFAGIANLSLSEDYSVISGIVSKEGERVSLSKSITIGDFPKVNDWLAALEKEMRSTLAHALFDAVRDLPSLHEKTTFDRQSFLAWVDKYPDQLVVLSMQVLWTGAVEAAFSQLSSGSVAAGQPLHDVLSLVESGLKILADLVLEDIPTIRRRKCEHLITELVHQRDIIRRLIRNQISSPTDFEWLYYMRFYFNHGEQDVLKQLSVKMADASFTYGFEYLGIADRLALHAKLGGSPFGPAGTGKTESVKALGVQLGRFVLVFCCDENFDFQAMGRIFIGLCRVGAWGCFDEFNRLEERILSAVSQQIQAIQMGLKSEQEVELVNKHFRVSPDTGIFITMNPGYAGRSNLPDNLKKLFRSIAMTKPDRELIAQVMLYSQGFRSAELLASKVVPLFVLCAEQLSPQNHYDFGLRSLKSVLVSAGNLKREILQKTTGQSNSSVVPSEQELLIRSVRETIIPKLLADDIALLRNLLDDVFPGVQYRPIPLGALEAAIKNACTHRKLVADGPWLEKVIQLYQIQIIHHGIMLVGPSGSGKSVAHQVLLEALGQLEGIEGVSYVIDPKAMSKEALYGHMDLTTREWTDGLFTHILRKIIDNVRGEGAKRHWIIFDGDVDPEWVENLNSVLDDNKMLTLPNGERLNLPPNVRIMFEVENLKQATLATVSRCGMVWFSEDTVTVEVVMQHYLATLRSELLTDDDDTAQSSGDQGAELSNAMQAQHLIADILAGYMKANGLVVKALEFASVRYHLMDFTKTRAIISLTSLINNIVRAVLAYDSAHPDFPLSATALDRYVCKRLLLAIVWSFAGDSRLEVRQQLGEFLLSISTQEGPAAGGSLIDYDVDISTGEWIEWRTRVPTIEIETHNVATADVVIPTVDTVRHEDILYSWLAEHKPIVLCGPPGSGKTMTLFAALRKLPEMDVVGLNFSSATTPELILQTFEQYCEYRKTLNGVILSPQATGRWLVLFCDEINLPAADKYGTQRVISFIRQLVEHGGFWRKSDRAWVKLERVQFVGACNPPTDPGRVPLSHRFLRHSPVVMVDYPGEESLVQIYTTFSKAMLKVIPALRGYSQALTAAMVDFYLESQKQFTADKQAHFIYSPRELTRWVRGIFECIKDLDELPLQGLVRIWAHEALRLFQDRLVDQSERDWTDRTIDEIAFRHFPSISPEVMERPILFSNWLSREYVPVKRADLREFVQARLKIFYEEELDVPLVLFNDVLEHVLRIDRVYRQPQGHLLLIGTSGSGKTTLARFVAWMNGLSVFQIKVHNKYTASDFDDDLRAVLRRAGCKGEKVCFIMDESNVLNSAFLEKMNTLLANAEVPGLFEGDEHVALLAACKEGAQREGLILDTADELYKWFTNQIMRNLHVVFTMNPPQDGLAGRAATSPALFNRCVLDWFGDWSDQAFFQVGQEFTATLDLDLPSYRAPADFPIVYHDLQLPPTYRLSIVNAFVFVHKSLKEINEKLRRRQGRVNVITPRHYLDFINHYVRLFNEKREDLEERQRHLNVGLEKLHETVVKVEELRKSLAVKRTELEAKNREANEKLKRMVADQQEAEQKKHTSLEIQQSIAQQNQEIEERRKVVLQDLAEAEPAVLEAQGSVSSIKKQHLQEVRTMSNPPEAVKMAMESVCILLGNRVDSWKTVQSIIRKDDFIASIVNYDTDKMSARAREEIVSSYLSNPKYNFETVNRASQACGPLVKWAIAQVQYACILERVGPLRQEVQELEESAEIAKSKATAIDAMIQELEESITRYKDEYAVLISETQSLKSEMETVQSRVERSLRLLDNLSSEKDRWEEGSQSFESQMGTIVGDVFLASAFLAYAGFFSQEHRAQLLNRWSAHLTLAGIKFRRDLSISSYLCTADERLAWHANDLPADDLCTENAIILKRFNRYPLLIDPAGQATTYLQNEYKSKRITVTSFLDDSFLKVLESALRFGTPLLVQDVEHLDPILNPVLNRELRKTGGRTLIRLGGQDIDFSPSFTLFLCTRDPSVNFAPDLCSRVTFVNFTVTRESLQNQCLHQVLKAESPETDRKRTDLLKLQGEFQLRLRHLEQSLLQALNSSKGNILEDDKVISTLEVLKQEAGEVSRKVDETDIIMQEVEIATAVYTPLAQSCSAVFFVMEQLSILDRFYQFSLDFFLEIFEFLVHKNPNLHNLRDPAKRLQVLEQDLFAVSFRRIAQALYHEDQLTLALLFSQIKLKHTGSPIEDGLMDHLIGRSNDLGLTKPSAGLVACFGADVAKGVAAHGSIPGFQGFAEHLEENGALWKTIIKTEQAPESNLPSWPGRSAHPVLGSFQDVLVVKSVRPDRVLAAATIFVQQVFGADFLNSSELNLKVIVMEELIKPVPVALCSPPGYDASSRIEQFAAEMEKRMTCIAMGSAEGFTLADAAIVNAARNGTWVLLKNVHLAPAWLSQLEKRLHSLKPSVDFRLFLTMETHPKVPANILRMARVLMFEPPPGIKANLMESLSNFPQASRAKGPSERMRVHFLLAWLHAVVQERLRYAPLGWSKQYEFNDSDQDMALAVINYWIDAAAQGRANIPPEKIPWKAIRILLKETVYGGKIDNEFDQRLLETFVDGLFTASSYNSHHPLVQSVGNVPLLEMPDGIRSEQFLDWIKTLPDQQPPTWLGLPNNAEMVRLIHKGHNMLSNVRKLRTTDEDILGAEGNDINSRSSRTHALLDAINNWQGMLPDKLPSMRRGVGDDSDPLLRFFERENQSAQRLLATVRSDLSELHQSLSGKWKQTNRVRELLSAAIKGTIPPHWLSYTVAKRTSLNEWLVDLGKRLSQLKAIAEADNAHTLRIWIGGFFTPEAFVTATRQCIAHTMKISLEELQLEVSVGDFSSSHTAAGNHSGFALQGMRLEGAEWTSEGLSSNSELKTTSISMVLRWTPKRENEDTGCEIVLPIYLNEDRQDVLFTAQLKVEHAEDVNIMLQRCVAIIANEF
ncbi:dynein heavy chain [Phlyctochytrium arcticum]|nr:dynein heavy chain [Phlyctochytrium arcticum]